MSSFTWVAGNTGDWAVSANWTSGTLPDSSAAVFIPDGSSGFVSQIGTADNEIINALTLGGFSGVTPTLDIAGTLQFAGGGTIAYEHGTIQVASTGLFEGSATGLFFSSPFTVSFINNGTVRADGGAGADLQILTAFTNNGTLLADNGVLVIGGQSLSNLVGSTLTGGTYIVEGPAAGTDNAIEFGAGNFNAIITSDAADIVLGGGASDIEGFASSSFQTLEQQLQTITSAGTLQLLSARGYTTGNAIADNGVLNLQGGTLSTGGLTVGATRNLEGFGVVANAVVDQGVITASGGVLDLEDGVSGTGALTVLSNATLILAGDTPSAITNNGVIYDTSGLLTVNSMSGTGTLVVQNGGTLDIGAATSETVVFSGSNATLQLANPSSYTGVLSGFGLGDELIFAGTAATANVVNGDTLAVISAGATVDSFLLAGNYTGASFSVTQSGSMVAVQNTAGAPARSDFQFSISLDDTAGLTTAEENEILNDLSAAADDWGQYITGHAPLRIQLDISNAASAGAELANGGFSASVATGEVIGGQTIYMPSSVYALTTGQYVSGTTSDININLPLTAGELGVEGDLYVNPTPFTSGGSVPFGVYDLVTVFRHEMAHGLGFSGFTNPSTGGLGADVTLFDHYIQDTIVGGSTITAANFVGPNAEAAYGAFLGTDVATPVPLTLLNNGENFFHVANSAGDPLGHDLMSGVGLTPGAARDISSVDLAMLQDAGLPVTAAIVCYVRGTRIAARGGEVAVENLAVGDCVLTASGELAPIIWIGRRRIDCRRHPHPDKVRPVRISAHAFAPGLPRRDLLVSPQHAIFANDVLIPARCLVNGRTVMQADTPDVEYFHIELARHDLLLAEGLPAESYLDCGDRGAFDNGDGPLVLHPDFAGRMWESGGCAELRMGGPDVAAVRRQLARRADVLLMAAECAGEQNPRPFAEDKMMRARGGY